MKTWHVHIQGQVQGIGFRPFVYRLATEMGLKGTVCNTGDGVHIHLNGEVPLVEAFTKTIRQQSPAQAKITHLHLEEIEPLSFNSFEIVHSKFNGQTNTLLSPDFALCKDCKREMETDGNRRLLYPFITCTNCGPRYSIITGLPYDRPQTEMAAFNQCSTCLKEYHNPLDRRYFSQTNSCPECGIQLIYDCPDGKTINDVPSIIEQITQSWADGNVIAIKGLGGYLLTCDANNPNAIKELRNFKNRQEKPFAVMLPDHTYLEAWFSYEDIALETLHSAQSPIVLFAPKPDIPIARELIAPKVEPIGVMLPYAPLFQLLCRQFGKPIVATSGNRNQMPIISNDQEASAVFKAPITGILSHNRPISFPIDDSVVAFSPIAKQKVIYRRARGLAPTFFHQNVRLDAKHRMAFGADLKSAFSIMHQNQIYTSQYLGNLSSFPVQERFRMVAKRFLNLLNTAPEEILCDAHPNYFSTFLASEMSEELNVPIFKILHHQAHFGAILGEHGLIESEKPIMGVIWDGTGYGADREIWGGEFFKYDQFDIHRIAHFEYFPSIAGDKMAKEPRIAALSTCTLASESLPGLSQKFTNEEWQVYKKLLQQPSLTQTSSVGRLFDAVSALLGLCDIQSYEGAAATQLEQLAWKHINQHGVYFERHYLADYSGTSPIPVGTIINGIILDINAKTPMDAIAATFHYTLVIAIKRIAAVHQFEKIAFSGGVFQNRLLLDLIHWHLEGSYDLYFHQQLSPNDENIGFGQLMVHQIHQHKLAAFNQKTSQTPNSSNLSPQKQKHVFSNSR